MYTMQILRDTYVSRVADREFTVRITDLSPEMLTRIVAYGVQRAINDAAGGGTGHERVAAAQKRYDAIIAGTWGARGTRGLSPVDTIAREMARAEVRRRALARGVTLTKAEETRLAGILAARPDFRAAAAAAHANASAGTANADSLLDDDGLTGVSRNVGDES